MSSSREQSEPMTEEEYQNIRKATYPDTWEDKFPSEAAKTDYYAYKKQTAEANSSTKKYRKQYKSLSGSQHANPERLSREHHGRLVLPAAKATTDSGGNHQARAAFMNDHPFAYHELQQRDDHEICISRAKRETKHYRDRYEIHSAGQHGAFDPNPTQQDPLLDIASRGRDANNGGKGVGTD